MTIRAKRQNNKCIKVVINLILSKNKSYYKHYYSTGVFPTLYKSCNTKRT